MQQTGCHGIFILYAENYCEGRQIMTFQVIYRVFFIPKYLTNLIRYIKLYVSASAGDIFQFMRLTTKDNTRFGQWPRLPAIKKAGP